MRMYFRIIMSLTVFINKYESLISQFHLSIIYSTEGNGLG